MEVDFYSTLESVREKIERGEKYYALLNDKSKWNQYCASLYAIEDAQCAIEAYTSYEYKTQKRSKKVVSFLLLFSYKLDIMNVPFYMFLAYPNRRDISGLILRFSHIILILDVLKNGKTRVEN